MSLLTLVNRAQAVLNLPVTTSVYTHTGEAQKQLLNLAQVEGIELAGEYAWQALITETSFTTTGSEQQTHPSAALPADLGFLIDETLYNRSAARRIEGPVGARPWQAQKAFGSGGADSQFRIRGNSIWIMPAPAAGQSVFYEYVSNLWCQSAGGTAQAAWAADADTGRLSEHVMMLGLVWRWKAAKGLPYEEDYNMWEAAKQRAAARDGARRKLSAAGATARTIGLGRIAEGSW